MKKYVYPGLFRKVKSNRKHYVEVTFPDLIHQGGYTFGRNMDHAIEMAKSALVLCIGGQIHDHEPLPEPSPEENIKKHGGRVIFIEVTDDDFKNIKYFDQHKE